ncbi:uncharacterized protein [Rutidosis leptorrhynchoides]|uniref:uncharacterized protein n=1 Tax=Rutidosis leptorrhynchoides TaxID=125765 RepID=UPI003A993155
MSDTLADLSSWLPSQFLSGDIDDKTLFHNNHLFPYDIPSSSSTESESDDDDFTGLTRHFTRSISLQERLKIPLHSHLQKNSSFSGSYPTTPFSQTEDDALERIYAAAGHVARIKMMMLMNNLNDDVYATRGILGAPFPFGPGPTLPPHQNHPNRAVWVNEKEESIREQYLRRTVSGGPTVGCRPVEVRQSAWPPLSSESQRFQQHVNGFVNKPFVPSYSRRGNFAVKKERAGTGVFLPQSYSNSTIPEIKKKQACSTAYLPAKVAQSYNKTMGPINPQLPNIHAVGPPQYKYLKGDELAELVIARRNAVMAAQQHQQRRTIPETPPVGPPEVVLPQEWTY